MNSLETRAWNGQISSAYLRYMGYRWIRLHDSHKDSRKRGLVHRPRDTVNGLQGQERLAEYEVTGDKLLSLSCLTGPYTDITRAMQMQGPEKRENELQKRRTSIEVELLTAPSASDEIFAWNKVSRYQTGTKNQ
jgi:hypothetical protein